MSSLRNSVQRRSHRERAQPLERQRLGLLEKKKDYQKRAKDYNKKKTILKSLREKAADRNEDEFYFGMLSRNGPGSRLSKGKSFTGAVENDRGNKAMDMDTVRLLKTQDLGYLRTMRNVAAKEVQDLEERYIIATGLNADDLSDEDEDDDDWSDDDDEVAPSAKKSKPTGPKKIVFCDDVEERGQIAAAEKRKAHRRISRVDSDDEMMDDVDDEEAQKRQKEAARKSQNVRRLQNKLKNAKKKLKALSDAERELEIQQAKMAKTATSGGITKTGRRIKVKERKR